MREYKSKYESMIGKTFGKLKVLSISKDRKDNQKKYIYSFNCLCECGNLKTVRCDAVVNNRTKSCGCIPTGPEGGKNNSLWTGFEDISGQYFSSIKNKAKKRNIPFDLTIEDAWDLFILQNKKCALTGEQIYFGKNKTASLDRIDSNLGYSINNCQWLHKDINILKNNLDQNFFIELCKKVAKYEHH